MDPRDWERQRLHKCLQGDGVRGRVGMQVPEGQTRMLHHARCHCHQICPNKLWSPRVSSSPALPPLSSPTMGLPVVQSGQGPACEGVQTEPSLAPGREAAAEDRGPQSSAPFPSQPLGPVLLHLRQKSPRSLLPESPESSFYPPARVTRLLEPSAVISTPPPLLSVQTPLSQVAGPSFPSASP